MIRNIIITVWVIFCPYVSSDGSDAYWAIREDRPAFSDFAQCQVSVALLHANPDPAKQACNRL